MNYTENIKNLCPCCGAPLNAKKYYEDVQGYKLCVETDAKCSCGYHYNYSYGVLELAMPEAEEELAAKERYLQAKARLEELENEKASLEQVVNGYKPLPA